MQSLLNVEGRASESAGRPYPQRVDRSITCFRQDELGDWIAELASGHRQHVRHRPPFEDRVWVEHEVDRIARIGSALWCPLCERADLPEGLVLRRSLAFDEAAMQRRLRTDHEVAEGSCGRLQVLDECLGFCMATRQPVDIELVPGMAQAVPPLVVHSIRLLGPVRCVLEIHTIDIGGDAEPKGAERRGSRA